MKKLIFSNRQANLYFASVNRAWNYLENGSHVQLFEDGKIVHGIVQAKWFGLDPRVVVVDDLGVKHFIRDISTMTILDTTFGGYVPALALG